MHGGDAPLTRLAEFIIGRRFAPTRWLATLSPQTGRGNLRRLLRRHLLDHAALQVDLDAVDLV